MADDIQVLEPLNGDGTSFELRTTRAVDVSSKLCPVVIIGNTSGDLFSIVGDGDAVDIEDWDGTVGTTKGVVNLGKDNDGKARIVRVDSSRRLVVSPYGGLNLLFQILDTLERIQSQLGFLTEQNLNPGERM